MLLRLTGPTEALNAPWKVAAADTITSSRIDCPSTSKYPPQNKFVNPVYPVVLIPCGGAEYMLVKYYPSPWNDVAVVAPETIIPEFVVSNFFIVP